MKNSSISYFFPLQFMDNEEKLANCLRYILGTLYQEAVSGFEKDRDGRFLPSFHYLFSEYRGGFLLVTYEAFIVKLGDYIKRHYKEYDLKQHYEMFYKPTKNAKYHSAREVLVVWILERFYKLLRINSFEKKKHKTVFLTFQYFRIAEYSRADTGASLMTDCLPFIFDQLEEFIGRNLLFQMRQFCLDNGISQVSFQSKLSTHSSVD